MFYDLTSSSWGDEEIKAAHQVIDSGNLTMGENVRRFEEDFATKFGVKHALMVSSGSAANLIGVAALFYRGDFARGDEVIVPAIAWATTYYPLYQYGLKFRFVDVDQTLNMDVSKLEEALTPKTRMVVAVSILGNPCDLEVMRSFCDKHGLILFEDNCESMGASLNGKLCGTFGDIGTFSTFYSHHISTMEGGVLVTDSTELYHYAKSLRAHGWTRDIPSGIYEKNEDDFYEAYRFILPGYNVRPLEISGAIGVEQLKKLDRMVDTRRKNAGFFTEVMKDDRWILQKENGRSSWFAFTIIVKEDRNAVLTALKLADIGYRMITGGNFLRHDVIRYFDHDCVGEMKNANLAHDNGFFVGNAPRDLRPQIEKLREVLR